MSVIELKQLPTPVGPRVLIKVDPIEEVSAGGIIVNVSDKGLKEDANTIGTLVSHGHLCWDGTVGDGTPWAKPGDRVMYSKWGGYAIRVNGEMYRIMADEDITAVVESGPNLGWPYNLAEQESKS